MSAPAALDSWRAIVTSLFPFLARVGVSTSGALAIKSAAGRTEVEGGTYPVALATVSMSGRLYWDSIASVLYYSPDATAAYVPIATGIIPPLPATPGTSIVVATGSEKVKSG